jgi:dihydroorotate dehydrogenase
MYQLLRFLLWRFEPETAHYLAMMLLRALPAGALRKPAAMPVTAMGLQFAHPVGLAAGFDCNGVYLNSLAKLGFSFIELGGTTPKPQPGNPKPRLFRIPKAHALINRMGFYNQGVDALVARIKQSDYQGILGVNIAKNKDTPLSGALDDYLYCMRRVYPVASYIAINLSSPNMPQLRALQHVEYFKDLMDALREEQLHLADVTGRYVPLVVKLSPDEADESLKRMGSVLVELGIDGIIATNTTVSRDGVYRLRYGMQVGGLSGRPLFQRSTACLRILKETVGDSLTLIGVGGVDSAETAREKLKAGASLVQLYSGLVYEGPGLVARIMNELASS